MVFISAICHGQWYLGPFRGGYFLHVLRVTNYDFLTYSCL